ncbi:GTP-binding protein [Candidatus Micrarchaeota archaeon]|nr:GTP-binding protein [Candidatus Micrarchaeota archaeon]
MILSIKRYINWLISIFKKEKEITIGFYGEPNVGKTSLANRISIDFTGEPVGSVSIIPHETRTVLKKEKVQININNFKLIMNLLDMPGMSVKVDYRDFLDYGMSYEQAQVRAKEATKGIIEAIKFLDKVDAALLVIDSTSDPYSQTNFILLGNIEARNIPVIIVANKIDREDSNSKRIKEIFADYPVVEISALTGENMELLYNAISRFSKRRK